MPIQAKVISTSGCSVQALIRHYAAIDRNRELFDAKRKTTIENLGKVISHLQGIKGAKNESRIQIAQKLKEEVVDAPFTAEIVVKLAQPVPTSTEYDDVESLAPQSPKHRKTYSFDSQAFGSDNADNASNAG